MNAQLTFPPSELRRLRAGLEAEGRRERGAAVRAINKAASSVATATGRGLATTKGLPVRVVRKRVRIRRANLRRPQARVWVGTLPVRVVDLGAPRQTRRGAAAGRRAAIPGAFVATMRSGHTGIFKRRGSARLPIEEQMISLLPEADTVLSTAMAGARDQILREYRRLLALPSRRPRRIRR